MNEQGQARLIVLSGKKKGNEHELPQRSATVGRTNDSDIVIKHKSISRIHARFDWDGRCYTVRDLGSKNGIRVNNRKVEEFTLHTGDLVSLGNVKMKFVDPSELDVPVPSSGPAAVSVPAPPPPDDFAAPAPIAPASVEAPPASALGDGPGRYVPPAERNAPVQPVGPTVAPAPPAPESAFAPPPEFFEADDDKESDVEPSQATIKTLAPYIAVIAVAGIGLALLAYETFRTKYEPFREDVKLAVSEVQLLDLMDYKRVIHGAQYKLKSARVAHASYNKGQAILTVKGLSLGDTELVFVTRELEILGTVRIHVLEPQTRDTTDYSIYNDEQLIAQAQNFIREGESLGTPHLASALQKFEEAVRIYNLLPEGTAGKDKAYELANQYRDERKKQFENLKTSLKQAWSLNNKPKAKRYLAKIMELYPDPSDENHQQARIFFERMRRSSSRSKKK